MQWDISDQAKHIDQAKFLLEYYKNTRIFAFYGEMGSGKTTFIQALTKVLGSKDVVNSPTYGIVNTYEANGSSIYHFDFYRIEHEDEAYDIGLEEYFDDNNSYSFIEWPEKIANLLPDDCVRLQFKVNVEARIIVEL